MPLELNKFRFGLLYLACGIVCSMCQRTPRPGVTEVINYGAVRDTILAKADSFVPLIGLERHRILRFRIEDEEIVPPTDTSSVKLRFGKMPRMNSSGTFHVFFFNSNQKELTRYSMRNPLYYRIEYGPGKGLKRVDSGYFYLPVPNDNDIVSIQLWNSHRGDSTRELDFSDISFTFLKPL